MTDHQLLKMLVQTLNDIRVLLADYYTREYVLESLRHFQKNPLTASAGADLLTFDSVRDFLHAIIELML